ncbi:BCCT family transporter [Algoriphagus namhaensis]|uniref:BCCT family transporter n=1 Tax=Algoriphagus namhaensis TaxID=915353 RepID=A0ABV8ASZ8_9BACT
MSKQSNFFRLNTRPWVFWPPFLALIFAVLMSLFTPEVFSTYVKRLQELILMNFSLAFSWTSFFLVLILVVVLFSPLGKYRIGGPEAKPRLSKFSWFVIVLCTTIATGILFWGSAEPLFHFYNPPSFFNFKPTSSEAGDFAVGALSFHWGFTVYAVYVVPSLVFGLMLYARKPKYTLQILLRPVLGNHGGEKWAGILDSICLFALAAGMSASLGAGIMSLSGGLQSFFPSWNDSVARAIITVVILITFLISSSTGIDKGIKNLSKANFYFFVVLITLFVGLGPGLSVLTMIGNSLGQFASNFLDLSLQLSGAGDQWTFDYTTFNLAVWIAWAPITALFLGKIALGRTVREFIIFNWILPSIFCLIWMAILGGTTIEYAFLSPETYKNILEIQGPESVVYEIFKEMGYFSFFSILFIMGMYISFVTAADSSTEALASISMKKSGKDTFNADINLKVLWGSLIAGLAWIMITFAGLDGVRMLSVIGGAPAFFILLLSALSLVLLMLNPKKYLP